MSRNRQYSKKELELLRRADLQNLYKIHGLKGANQKSDALIDTLVVHFSSSAYVASPESPSGPSNRRLKSIDIQTSTRITKDAPKRPATASSGSRLVKAPIRPPSRLKKAVEAPSVPIALPPTISSIAPPEWEQRLQRMEEMWMERLKRAEADFEEKLRLVEERWEARWTSVQSNAQTHPSPPASTPRVVVIDPSPLKRPLLQDYSMPSTFHGEPVRKRLRSETASEEATPPRVDVQGTFESFRTPPEPVHDLVQGSARKRLRSETASEEATPPRASRQGTVGIFRTPTDPIPDPRTPDPSHQGMLDDMSRTPGVGNAVEGSSYPIFATTPKPAEARSPTLDAPHSASRRRAWSSNSMPKMLTPGRKRAAAEVAPRAVSQAHMDLTTITESDEAPIQLRRQTTPVLFPPARSRDRTTTPPRLSPSPSITERAFQHPAYPSRGSSLVPQGPRPRQTSTPAREYMDVALHGLPNPIESPSGFITPGHRTILGTERYRDTRFGDIPSLSWGSPSVDFGSATPAPRNT